MNKVGRFNVYLYPECNIDANGAEYHLLDLSEWDDNKLVKQNFLYIDDESFKSHYRGFENEKVLAKLINKPKYSKIHLVIKTYTLIN